VVNLYFPSKGRGHSYAWGTLPQRNFYQFQRGSSSRQRSQLYQIWFWSFGSLWHEIGHNRSFPLTLIPVLDTLLSAAALASDWSFCLHGRNNMLQIIWPGPSSSPSSLSGWTFERTSWPFHDVIITWYPLDMRFSMGVVTRGWLTGQVCKVTKVGCSVRLCLLLFL
jgi:hypothetical protein